MYIYIVKYKHINVKIIINNKKHIVIEARKALEGKLPIGDNLFVNVFEDTLKEFYILDDLDDAPDKGILKLEDRDYEK